MLRSLLYTFFLLLVFTAADAQELSNKGKEFWVGYGYHQDMKAAGNALNDQDMRLYFTSDVAAAVKVEIPGVGWSKTYQVTANAVTESDPIPKDGGQDSRLNEEGTFNRGIHITSNQPIVAYAHIYSSSNSGASLLFPVETLGSDYYSLNFTQKANTGDAHSWAFVIATEDNTEVEITPSAKTLKHNAGQSFVVPLKKGEIFNLMGETTGLTGVDLTGTRIRSVRNGIQSCEKIAVFSGAGRVSINCDNAADAPSADNLIQQVFPRSAWGNKYLTVPTAKLSNNYFRIAVNDPSTVVTVGGVRLTKLERNFYYEIIANTPQSIVSDKPVMVAQYITSSDANGSKPCGNSFGAYGDPEMIYISPIEQTIDKITLNSTRHYQIAYHYINVIIKSSAVQSFRLDGVPGAGSFSTHAGDPAFSFATFEVKAGSHNLRADAGFNAIAYGYGETESYGYNAGTNIKDLNRFITIQNPYSPVDIPVTCKNTIFSPSLTLPYQPSSIILDFADNPNLSPSQALPISNPVVSRSYGKDGVTLYVYTLQTQFTFNGTGTFPVKVTTDNSSANSCNGQQVNTFDITVLPAPIADFTYTHSGCATDAATFKDASTDNGKPLYKWVWDFGDGPADTRQNPPKTFSAAATYNVKLTAINDIGCFGETTKPLIIDPQPVADFNFSSPACVNSPVTFTDASTIPSGSITKWYWNFGNGKTTTETSKAPITTMYETTGPKSVSLQVENSSGCKSAVVTKSITVYASPTVDFDLAAVCLPSGVAMFNNLSSISDGTAASLTFLWGFGDGGTSTDKNPSYPYKTTGPFSVLLKATSAAGCSKDSTKIVSNIYEQPKAVFTNSAKLCVPDSIYFTDNSTASNSSVTEWNWNFGDGTTSKLRNPAKKYAAKGSYIVTLSIRSAAGCISQTEQKTIIINEAPTAAFAISNSTCENQPVTITDQSKANSGSIQYWSWIFGDGTS
ncbi:MAG: hypothetical protein JWP77_2797, partial [Polaromonas sp.]|nr:hypothetical protein [Polaromonas sp.]